MSLNFLHSFCVCAILWAWCTWGPRLIDSIVWHSSTRFIPIEWTWCTLHTMKHWHQISVPNQSYKKQFRSKCRIRRCFEHNKNRIFFVPCFEYKTSLWYKINGQKHKKLRKTHRWIIDSNVLSVKIKYEFKWDIKL